jgi:quinoprotein glucose dehydrogenase
MISSGKKIFKLIFFLIFLIFLFALIDMVSISSKYVNRSLVTFDVNNITNPQVKKIVRKLDQLYSLILLNVSSNQRKHFVQSDTEFKNLPEEKIIIGKTDNFTLNHLLKPNNSNDWKRSHGNSSANRFSSLKQINLNNIDKLDLVWKYKFDKIKRDIQANPIIAENKIFLPTSSNEVIALDAKSGKKVWQQKVKGTPARRGMVFWSGKNNENSRIYFCVEKELLSLQAIDGKAIKAFGNNGSVKLKRRCTVAPVIINNKLIIATFEPAVEVYNLLNGKLDWKFYLKEKKFNMKRYGGKRYDYSGGNPWSGISADVERGIVFVTTGNAGYYFNGVNRPGNNKYSNSVIAIDILNKKKLWDFQEVSHDIWNLDIPATPILTSIKKNDLIIDVVVAVTKLGNTLILDRLSGEPIFDFHFKKAPQSIIPGEKTSYYQPNVKIPEPFSKQIFNENEITNISAESEKFIRKKIQGKKFGFFLPHELKKKIIYFGFHGGAEWMGASVNNNNGMMYLTSSNTPWEAGISIREGEGYYKYASSFNRLVDQNGYPGSKPPWGTLTALDLNIGKIIWQVPFGEYKELTQKGIPVTGTENYGGATGTEGNLIFATGTLDKKIRAFNSNNGEEVWSYELPFVGSGPPSVYAIDGEQYIVVASTGSYSLKNGYPELAKFGNWLYCFKLKE